MWEIFCDFSTVGIYSYLLRSMAFSKFCDYLDCVRPRKRWEDGVAEDARDVGIRNWRRVTVDRVCLLYTSHRYN